LLFSLYLILLDFWLKYLRWRFRFIPYEAKHLKVTLELEAGELDGEPVVYLYSDLTNDEINEYADQGDIACEALRCILEGFAINFSAKVTH